jgi:phosphotransferase system HPr-like phosphotransfer protein
MLLEATEGTPIEVTVEGSDEATVLKAIEHVFEEGGGI